MQTRKPFSVSCPVILLSSAIFSVLLLLLLQFGFSAWQYAQYGELTGAIATFLAILIVLFGDALKKIIKKPNIEIEHSNVEPYNRIALPPSHPSGESYYVRLKIKNTGTETAKGIYVKLIEIRKQDASLTSFDPITLHWVGSAIVGMNENDLMAPVGGREVYEKRVDLAPTDFEYVDLFNIGKTSDTLEFISNNPQIDRNRGINLVQKRGRYTLKICIYGENFEPIEREVKVIDENGQFDTVKIEIANSA